jgi:hypothetical protein
MLGFSLVVYTSITLLDRLAEDSVISIQFLLGDAAVTGENSIVHTAR